MATTVLAGCQNEDPINQVVEGLPVSISFNVEVPNMDNIVVTRATDEQETRIEKMAILFYVSGAASAATLVPFRIIFTCILSHLFPSNFSTARLTSTPAR